MIFACGVDPQRLILEALIAVIRAIRPGLNDTTRGSTDAIEENKFRPRQNGTDCF
jgi:hypothetical protein